MKKIILTVVMSFLLVNIIGVILNDTQNEDAYTVADHYYQTSDEDDGGTRG